MWADGRWMECWLQTNLSGTLTSHLTPGIWHLYKTQLTLMPSWMSCGMEHSMKSSSMLCYKHIKKQLWRIFDWGLCFTKTHHFTRHETMRHVMKTFVTVAFQECKKSPWSCWNTTCRMLALDPPECVKTTCVLLLVGMFSGGGAGRCQYCVDTSVQSRVSPAPDNTHAASIVILMWSKYYFVKLKDIINITAAQHGWLHRN